MPMSPWINIRPGLGTEQTATPRSFVRQGSEQYFSRGVTISGDASRDPGNTGDINILRPGLALGRIDSVVNSLGTVGDYAPSCLGLITNAEAVASTAIEASAAVVTEIARRIGATGTFYLVGPPAANGVAAQELVTYSAASGTSITVTALTNAFVAGSLILPTDGSENIRTFVAEPYGFNVFDAADNVTAIRRYMARTLMAGVLDFSQLLPFGGATDTGILAYLRGAVAGRAGGGVFILDSEF